MSPDSRATRERMCSMVERYRVEVTAKLIALVKIVKIKIGAIAE